MMEVGQRDPPVLDAILDIVPVDLTKVPRPADLSILDAAEVFFVLLRQELGSVGAVGQDEWDHQAGGQCGKSIDQDDPSPCSPLVMS
jgi:hypothetical protein